MSITWPASFHLQDPRMAQAIARSGFGSPREASRIPNETADEESTEDLAPGSP